MKSAAGDSVVLQLPGGYRIPDRAGSVLRAHFCPDWRQSANNVDPCIARVAVARLQCV
ncbi:MAG: hypothetical protein QOJ51_2979, partial [Acidobacteriaceae bacterium]|nr:hypothetical protein [Acidobacteriaceae bacterium]